MGLILVYRTTRIVNFAYGAMGAMPGSFTVGLFVAKGWNYWVAILLGVAVGVATGAAVETLVIRRFARSSRLVLTVASIGLAQLLGAIGLAIGVALGTDALIGNIETPLSSFEVFVRPYPVRGDHLLMIATAAVVLVGLAWYLLRTDAGMAVRAAAENQDRALLLGIPVRRLQTVVWAVAGGLSTITFITKAPFGGVVPEALVGATTILPGLAVAAVARFQSLPVAFWAGIGLGIAEWTIRWNVSAASIFDVTFFLVILGALLLRKVHTSRAETGESSWDAAGVLKPIPRRAARPARGAGPEAGPRRRRRAALLVVLALGAAPSTVSSMSFAVVWAMVATSLVVLTGWGGNVSLGQFALVGAGAMVAGNLIMRWNVDFIVAAIAATLGGAVVALAVGLPALRIRGLYLAVTTLAFSVALDSYFLNPVNFSSWVPQSLVRPVLWKRFDLDSEWATFYVCLGALLLTVALVRSIRNTRPGRVIIGTRDNERAADAFGVPTTRGQDPDVRAVGRHRRARRRALHARRRADRHRARHLPAVDVDRGVLVLGHRRPRLHRRGHLGHRAVPRARLLPRQEHRRADRRRAAALAVRCGAAGDPLLPARWAVAGGAAACATAGCGSSPTAAASSCRRSSPTSGSSTQDDQPEDETAVIGGALQ